MSRAYLCGDEVDFRATKMYFSYHHLLEITQAVAVVRQTGDEQVVSAQF
jgi:hypothetical protein